MARLVQIVLTDDQCETINAAMRDASNSEDITLEESKTIYDLGYLFLQASEDPSRFPLTGKKSATLSRKLRRVKGPAQPVSRKNKRKARQEKRQGWNKARRRMLAKNVAAYNEAVAIYAAERAEMDVALAEQQVKLDAERKFDVFTVTGERIVSGIPESMIRLSEVDKDVDSIAEDATPEIILP